MTSIDKYLADLTIKSELTDFEKFVNAFFFDNSGSESDRKGLSSLIYSAVRYLYVQFNIDPLVDSKDGFINLLYGISDSTFYNSVREKLNQQKHPTQDTEGTIYDHSIDAIIYINSESEIINPYDLDFSEDNPNALNETEAMSSIVLLQSKSGKNSTRATFVDLSNGIVSTLNGKKEDLKSNQLVYQLNQLFINDKLVGAQLYPVVTTSSDKFNHDEKDRFSYSLNSIEKIVNQKSISVCTDLESLIFSKNLCDYIPASDPLSSKNLTYSQIESFNYPGSATKSYIVMSYIRDFLSFISKKSKQSTQIEEGLFLRNVRGSVGNNQVTRSIKNTFIEGPSGFSGDFWWLSNGVTIICDKIKSAENSSLTLKNPQIVNGQQTSRQLFTASKYPEFDLHNPQYSPWKVMIKLLVIDPSDGEDTQKIITEIISGLNSQTAIGPVTLDLNNDFTMNIQSILRNKNLPNDKRVYIEIRPGEFTKNKHYKAQKDQILQMSTLMQYLFSTNWFTKNSISIGSIRSSKATTIRRYSKVLEDDVTTRLEHLNEQDKNKIWVLLVNLISIFEKSWGTFVHDPKKEKLEGINYLKFAAFRLIVNTHKLEFSIQSLQKGTEDYHKFKWFEDSISSLSKTMEAYTKANGQVNWDQFSKKLEFEELLKIDSTKTF